MQTPHRQTRGPRGRGNAWGMRKIFVNSASGPFWYDASEFVINDDGVLEILRSGNIIAVYSDGGWVMAHYTEGPSS